MAQEKKIVENGDRSISPESVYTILKEMIRIQQPVMLWGQPGIGKSELTEQIANDLGRNFIDIRLVTMDATDLRGIPYYSSEEKVMKWAQAACLPTDPNDTSILFLDELTAADPSQQKAALQLVLNRRIGDYILPNGCAIVAAGNRDTDKTSANKMISALANRFVHLTMTFDFQSWRNWAFKNSINPDIIGFLSAFPQYANTFDPKTNCKIFATPRTWTFVSKLLETVLPEHLLMDTIAGTVGEGVMYAFKSHRELSSKLPRVDDILTGEVTSLGKEAKNISVQHALITALLFKLNSYHKSVAADKLSLTEWSKLADNFVGFIGNDKNIEPEIATMGLVIAHRNLSLPITAKNCPNINKFFKDNAKLFTAA